MRLIDFRQITFRGILQQIFPWIAGQNGQTIVSSVDFELTPPFKLDAQNPASLTISVGPSVVVNTVNNRNKSTSFLGTEVPVFTSGTVTAPSSSGGNITTSTGGSFPLTLPSGDYVQILLAIDLSNHINVTIGVPNAVLASAAVPPAAANTAPFGYFTLHNIGGTIQNIAQSAIYQFYGSTPESASGSSTTFGMVSNNDSGGSVTVLTGTSLFNPYLDILSPDTYTVQTGAELVSVSTLIVNGVLVVNGITRVL